MQYEEKPSFAASTQERVVRFLSAPSTHGGAAVEHIQTHISHVFLVGGLAYKMKKAVRLPFVDFTSLQARRKTCENEISVNARTAPDIYLDVVAVNEGDKGLEIGPPARAIEYLVRMRRFPQENLFDRMAAEGRLTPALVRGLADAAAGLHISAARKPKDPLAEDFEITATDLMRRLADAVPDPATEDAVEQLEPHMRAALNRHLPHIRARARHGGVRHAHGDLHLRNICLFEGNVRLFDAIEFEPKYSHIDILYDIAFAAMDLLHRDRNADAVLMLGRYLSATRDYAELGLLRLFRAVRAGVRALVAMLGDADDRIVQIGEYLALASDLLAQPPAPRLIAIGGRSGTGKSTLAHALAPQLASAPNIVIIRADEVRKRLWDVPPESPLPDIAYAPHVTARVYQRMLRDAGKALDAGATAILDASFLDIAHREAVANIATRHRVHVVGLWLTSPTDVLERRLNQRSNDASDADTAVMRRQRDPKPSAALEGIWHCLESSGRLDESLARALTLILGHSILE